MPRHNFFERGGAASLRPRCLSLLSMAASTSDSRLDRVEGRLLRQQEQIKAQQEQIRDQQSRIVALEAAVAELRAFSDRSRSSPPRVPGSELDPSELSELGTRFTPAGALAGRSLARPSTAPRVTALSDSSRWAPCRCRHSLPAPAC